MCIYIYTHRENLIYTEFSLSLSLSLSLSIYIYIYIYIYQEEYISGRVPPHQPKICSSPPA